jgi:hypothetical protein
MKKEKAKQLYQKNDFLEVTWKDSHKLPGWRDISEVNEFINETESFIIHTCGYFLAETEDYLYLIQSFDSQIVTNVEAIISIFKKAIVKINKLKEVNKSNGVDQVKNAEIKDFLTKL